jgi:hypothetical protein
MGERHEELLRDWASRMKDRFRVSEYIVLGNNIRFFTPTYRGSIDFAFLLRLRERWRLWVVDFKHAPTTPNGLAEQLQAYRNNFPHSWDAQKRIDEKLGRGAHRWCLRSVEVVLVVDQRNTGYLRFLERNMVHLETLGFKPPLWIEVFDPPTGRFGAYSVGQMSIGLMEMRDQMFGRQSSLEDVTTGAPPDATFTPLGHAGNASG